MDISKLKIQDVAKALGQLSSAVAEATGSDLGVMVLVKDKCVGLFLGGDARLDKDQIVRQLRQVSVQIQTLADSMVKGETQCDGICYGMNQEGKVVPLDKPSPKKPSTGEADFSLLT